MHSNIERELKHRVVYTPDQIYTIITNAKVSGEKYNIKEMMQTEFYNIKELINNKNWIKDAPHLWSRSENIVDPNNGSECFPFTAISIKIQIYYFDAEYSELNTEPVRKIRSKRGTRQLASTSRLASPSPAHVCELQSYTMSLFQSVKLYMMILWVSIRH